MTSFLLSFLFPPYGFIVLWFRSGFGLVIRILLSFLLVLWTLAELLLLLIAGMWFGLLMPGGGGGIDGFYLNWTSESEHIRMLEASRSQTKGDTEVTDAELASATYWTGFRGPNRDGVYDQMPINLSWPEDGLPLMWKQPVGGGHSSMSVANGLVYTIEQRLEQEVVAAYDLVTGNETWTHSWDARYMEAQGGPGPRSTPTYDDGNLYVMGALGDLWCLDAQTGEPLWNTNVLEDYNSDNLFWGTSVSPLIHDSLVIVHTGGGNSNAVVAYDKLDGSKQWAVLDDGQEYVSPQFITLTDQKHVITITTQQVLGFNPENGSLLWEFPWQQTGKILISQPLQLPDNRIFASGGYGRGSVMIQVDPSTTPWSAIELWSNRNMKNKMSASVYHDGYIYGLDEGVLVCLNPETGEREWKAGRYGHGQMILADGHLVIVGERGFIALVEATPEGHNERSRFDALEGRTWNVPAMSDGYLLVRNTTEMACFRIAADEIPVP